MSGSTEDFDSQIGYHLSDKVYVHIGNKEEWIDAGRTTNGRVVWQPSSKENKKADPGRNYWCCYRGCMPLIVNQGAINSWSFRRKSSHQSLDCRVQKTISDFSQTTKTNEGKKHKYAKQLLYDYLNHDLTMVRLSISKVFLEEKFDHDDGLIQPDITIEHLNGSRTFVEIVDYSSPHKNSNAWKFYEKQQENLVVIDIKNNQEGWHFNTEKIHMILIEKFEKHFIDRTNYAKMWDEIYEICFDYEKREIENNYSTPWRGLESYHSSIKSWKLACETLTEEYRIEFDNLIKIESSIESICDKNLMLQTKLEPSLVFSSQLPKGREIRMYSMLRKVFGADGNEQVENTKFTWLELYRKIAEDYPFLLLNIQNSDSKIMILEENIIFTDVKFDYWTTVSKTWKVIESIQNERWIEINWNLGLEEKTKSVREKLEQEQAEIDRKISIYENFKENKASPAERVEYFTIVGEYLSLQSIRKENKNLLELDLHTFARQKRVAVADWTFHPINLDEYRASSSLTFGF